MTMVFDIDHINLYNLRTMTFTEIIVQDPMSHGILNEQC